MTAATSSPTRASSSTPTSRARFLDPGPYGCLGMGPGYALAAGLAHPDRQVVLLLGDGAAGFALGDFEALARHGVDVVAIVGNNGIWGLEKHPMQALFGYDVVAELRPGIRYDEAVRALGGNGECVARRGGDRPRARPRVRDEGRHAVERAHGSGRRVPALEQSGLTARAWPRPRVRGRVSESSGPRPRARAPWPWCRRAARAGARDLLDRLHRRVHERVAVRPPR